MSKFFESETPNSNNNMNNNMNNGYNQGYYNGQGNVPYNNMNSQPTETFVFNSYPSNNVPLNNGQMNNNQMNGMPAMNGRMSNQMPAMQQQAPNVQQNYNMQQMPMQQQMVQPQQVPVQQQLPQQAQKPVEQPVLKPSKEIASMNSLNNLNSIEDQPDIPKMKSEVLDDNDTLTEDDLPKLDPMNNSSNPVPVNPVAPVQTFFDEEELTGNVKANVMSIIGMIKGMILTPGTTIVANSKKYKSADKALLVTGWITLVIVVLSMLTRLVVGAFDKSFNIVTGESHVTFNMNNLFLAENYIPYLIIAIFISVGTIMVVSLVYYASSFFRSKGIPIGSYIMVSNLAFLPLMAGTVTVYPIISIISRYLGLLAFIFVFLYSLVSFLMGINCVLTFKDINRQILYNVINLSVSILILIVLFIILIKANILVLPELYLQF